MKQPVRVRVNISTLNSTLAMVHDKILYEATWAIAFFVQSLSTFVASLRVGVRLVPNLVPLAPFSRIVEKTEGNMGWAMKPLVTACAAVRFELAVVRVHAAPQGILLVGSTFMRTSDDAKISLAF